MTIPEILNGIKKLQRAGGGRHLPGPLVHLRSRHLGALGGNRHSAPGNRGHAKSLPDGGGTVANNLAALGPAKVAVLGVRGDDGFGFELDRALTERGIDASLMVEVRQLANLHLHQALEQSNRRSRTNRERTSSTPSLSLGSGDASSSRTLPPPIEEFDVVLVADQAETSAGGVVTPAVRESLDRPGGKVSEKIFLADSRRRVHLFRNVMVKPNHSEAEAACQQLFGHVDFNRLREILEPVRCS